MNAINHRDRMDAMDHMDAMNIRNAIDRVYALERMDAIGAFEAVDINGANPRGLAFRDWRGPAPAMVAAAREGGMAVGPLCAEASASELRQRDDQGHSALHAAAARGHITAVQLLVRALRRVDATRALARAELNAPAHDGATPLLLAVAGGHLLCAQRLLRAGARPGRSLGQQDSEMSLFFERCMARPHGRLPRDWQAILIALSNARDCPSRPARPGVPALAVLAVETARAGPEAFPLALQVLEYVLQLWPRMPLPGADGDGPCVLLEAAMGAGPLFPALWNYFWSNGELSPATVNRRYRGESLLTSALIGGQEDAALLLLRHGADALQWDGVRADDVEPWEGADEWEEDGWRWEAEDGEEAEGHEEATVREEAGNREQAAEPARRRRREESGPSAAPGADALPPLAVAMRAGLQRVVRTALARRPTLWDTEWGRLVDCCRRAGSARWLARLVGCRRGPPTRLPPLGPARPGEAPPTAMDVAMEALTARRRPPTALLARHFDLLLRSCGPGDARPSPTLLRLLRTCPPEEVAPLLALAPPPPSPEAAHALFTACLRSTALLAAAVAAGARPLVPWGQPGEDAALAELSVGADAADRPRWVRTVTAVLLGGHPRLAARHRPPGPFPLLWTALAAARAALQAAGAKTHADMEAMLAGRPPGEVDLVLLRPNACPLLGPRDRDDGGP